MVSRRVMPAAFVVMWSSALVAGIIGVAAAPPLLLTAVRFGVAGLALGAFALAVRAPWPKGRALGHVVVSGLLVQAVQFAAFYTAMGFGMPAAVLSLMQGLSPVVIALAAGRALGERVTGRQWAGFALGAAGVALAVSDRAAFSAGAIALGVVGLLGMSAGTVYQKRFASGMDVRTGTAVQVLVSAPVVAAASLALETPRVSDWAGFSWAVAWLVLVNSIGAFLLLNTMLKRAPASRVSTLFFLTPSVTALMAWALAGQSLHPIALAGLALGGAGVLLAARDRRGRKSGQEDSQEGTDQLAAQDVVPSLPVGRSTRNRGSASG
ncbi:DMT family transporter [Nonomuraea sp. NBC_01738]|uniref:DMT family transporter n=1 Tax=Nonomuraea sp. NBC_01738 TaxID=2976003 RepID=UPI002E0D39D4|nr:DMT family transporter [Nonomuraea sp. NBC_01738]